MSQTSFYSPDELRDLGLAAYGKNVLISRKSSLYGTSTMQFGDHVRIDDFCILSGEIQLGSYVHISAYSALYARFGIKMCDYTGLSPRVTILSASDDFSGNYMVGPMVDEVLTSVQGGRVVIGKFSQIGAGSIVLPSVQIGEGAAVGSMSFVNADLAPWTIYAGVPAKALKPRQRNPEVLSTRILLKR